MSWRHPSDEALGRWSGGAKNWRADRHARHCPMCLDRLEQITELEPRLRAQLDSDVAPRPTLERKLWDRLESRLAEREALAVATELMSVGPETSWVLLESPDDDGDDDE